MAMNDDAYREYCRCWQVYLDRVGDKGGKNPFADRLRERLPGWKIKVWPTAWPNVDHLFESDRGTGMANFTAAVQYAEQAEA